MKAWCRFVARAVLIASTVAMGPVCAFSAPILIAENTLDLLDHARWLGLAPGFGTILDVVVTQQGLAVKTKAGWISLNNDLSPRPASWAMALTVPPDASGVAVGPGVVWWVPSQRRQLVYYWNTGVYVDRQAAPLAFDHFVLSQKGFLFQEGRRIWSQAHWNKTPREEQPLPFFPSAMVSSSNGTVWALEELQGRIWSKDNLFWEAFPLPETIPGPITTIAPWDNEQGLFVGGPGWIGALNKGGTLLWSRSRAPDGSPLAVDLRMNARGHDLYFWTPGSTKIRLWRPQSTGPSRTVAVPEAELWWSEVSTEIDRLESVESFPEAKALAESLNRWMLAQIPTKAGNSVWRQRLSGLQNQITQLGQKAGETTGLLISWSYPYQRPLATWDWQPEGFTGSVRSDRWAIRQILVWQGSVEKAQSFRIARAARKATWPGVLDVKKDALQLPSYASVHWTTPGENRTFWMRLPLPMPYQPYDLPTE